MSLNLFPEKSQSFPLEAASCCSPALSTVLATSQKKMLGCKLLPNPDMVTFKRSTRMSR